MKEKTLTTERFTTRLLQFMAEKGLNNEQLSRCAGISSTAVGNYFKIGSIPKITVLAEWTSKLGINANWLLTGKGEMIVGSDDTSKLEQNTAVDDNALLKTLINTNSRLVAENAELRTKLELLEKSGKGQSTDALNAFGDGIAAHTLQRKTE